MGYVVASDANGNVVLGPADSAAQRTLQVNARTAAGQPEAQRTLWTGALYVAALAGMPIVDDFEDYRGVRTVDSGVTTWTAAYRWTVRANVEAWDVRLHEIEARRRTLGPDFPNWALVVAHDVIFELRRGTYLMWQEVVAGRLTAVQFGAWLALSAQGPTDEGYDPDYPERTFFPVLYGLDDTARVVHGALGVASKAPRTAGGVDFDRYSIQQMLDRDNVFKLATDADMVTPSTLDDGGWIRRSIAA